MTRVFNHAKLLQYVGVYVDVKMPWFNDVS